jgi:5'-deoxynucleotidase
MREPTEREVLEVMDALLGFYSKELKRSDDPADKLTMRQVRLEAEKACRAFLAVSATPAIGPSEKEQQMEQHAEALGWLEDTRRDLVRLREAVAALYFAAYWHPDRDVDEQGLWTAVRDAAGITPGQTGARLGPDRSPVSAMGRSECPYCTSDNEAIRSTYYDQTCEGCVKRMGRPDNTTKRKDASMKLTLYDFLRVGHIKRWHNVNTVRQQTVAEHSYMVMLIAIDLFQTMIGIDPENRDSSRTYAFHILLNAMFHDAPEVAAGDTPTPAKRLIREITGDPAIFDKVDEMLMPKLPYAHIKPGGKDIEPYIKMADAIEGYHFIHENGAGTHAQIVIAAARRKMEDMVEKCHQQESSSGWYEAVNRVLMALNLPYVHRESRISPP